MELEKIRQSDSEVRWQHDEDVLECNSCKKTFQNRKEKVSLFFLDSLQLHNLFFVFIHDLLLKIWWLIKLDNFCKKFITIL